MIIFNRDNSKAGGLTGLKSFMLIGETNCSASNISIQYSEVDFGKEQPLHQHDPEQCYFIIDGEGMMFVGDETREVQEGDAIYIPSNAVHGIKNTGSKLLKYLTANSPAFGNVYENKLWPKG